MVGRELTGVAFGRDGAQLDTQDAHSLQSARAPGHSHPRRHQLAPAAECAPQVTLRLSHCEQRAKPASRPPSLIQIAGGQLTLSILF